MHASSNVVFSNFGRSRSTDIGTMDFSGLSISGCASGSLWAAAAFTSPSMTVGMAPAGALLDHQRVNVQGKQLAARPRFCRGLKLNRAEAI